MLEKIYGFRELKQCPKCGELQRRKNYCDGTVTGINCAKFTKEHLHVTCAICGYEWLELTKDKNINCNIINIKR